MLLNNLIGRGFLSFHEKHFPEAAEFFGRVIAANPTDSVAAMYLDKAHYFTRLAGTLPLR